MQLTSSWGYARVGGGFSRGSLRRFRGAAVELPRGRAPCYTANFSLPKTLPKRLPQEAPRRSPKGAQEACLFNSQMPESFWHLKIEGSNSQMPESFWHLRIKEGLAPSPYSSSQPSSAQPAQPSPAHSVPSWTVHFAATYSTSSDLAPLYTYQRRLRELRSPKA